MSKKKAVEPSTIPANNEENALRFLSEASITLSSSLNYQTTLDSIARLIVPGVADFCAVEIVSNEGEVERLATAHIDPKKEKLTTRLRRVYPIVMKRDHPVVNVIKSGKSVLINDFDIWSLKEFSYNSVHFNALKSLDFKAYLVVPLSVRGRVLGAIIFARKSPSNPFKRIDLNLAEEIGRRAGIAIDNARLYEEAQQAVRIRDHFLSIASHELKTPITTLKGFTQILQSHFMADSKTSLYLDKMDSQIVRLTELVNDLLDVSRLREARLILEKENFSLNQLITDVIESIQPISHRHEILFNPTNTNNVLADKVRLSQVLLNLISNAIKFSPNGRKVLVMSEQEKDYYVVSVQDFGIGIKKEYQNRIFEPFFQGGSEKKWSYSGLGLGLHISSEIIKLHGGSIWVKSSSSKGTTITFKLPV